jgi:hypothetical protein
MTLRRLHVRPDPRGVVGHTCVKTWQSGLRAPDASGYDAHYGDTIWVPHHEGAPAIRLPKHIKVRSTQGPSFTLITYQTTPKKTVLYALILRFLDRRLEEF